LDCSLFHYFTFLLFVFPFQGAILFYLFTFLPLKILFTFKKIFHSSLFTLPSSLFPLPSSLFPLPSSLFILPFQGASLFLPFYLFTFKKPFYLFTFLPLKNPHF